MRTHWDLQSQMQEAQVIMVSLNAKFHALENQLALKRSEHIASTPDQLNTFWDSDQFCAFDILH